MNIDTRIVVFYGSFSLPTKQLKDTIEGLKDQSKNNNSEFFVYSTNEKVSKKNLLSTENKVVYTKELTDVSLNVEFKNITQIFESLKHYRNVSFIMYDKDEYDVVYVYAKQMGIDLTLVDIGVNELIILNFVKLNDFEKFKENLPLNTTNEIAKQLFDDIKHGLKIK